MKYIHSIGRLEVASCITGFALMTYELAAARVMAPTIGSSTYVWTSVIGVIIAALSLGYFVGGVIADKRGYQRDVGLLLLATTLMVTVTLLLYEDSLATIATWSDIDVRLQAVIAATWLFAPASFLLGMISPYLAKLNVRSLAASGRSVASLSAFNSIGGILGTFITGFVLFGYIGSRETIALVAVLLLLTSWLFVRTYRFRTRAAISLMIVGLLILPLLPRDEARAITIDTASAHYEISDFFYNLAYVRGVKTGPNGIQSAVDLSGSNEPVFWYTSELARLTLEQQPSRVLMLGGGTFTLPRYLSEKLPDATIDVVEIDPELEDIAKEYFFYDSPDNVELIFADARTYINQTTETYDVIIADVYGDTSIPFSLMTKEYGEALADRLSDGGVVVANIIGGVRGPCRDIFRSISAAYMTDLQHGWYKLNPSAGPSRGNMVALYTNRDDVSYGDRVTPGELYSDNYAPAERLFYSCNQQ